MNNIELSDRLYLGKGGERKSYIYPQDNNKIIKIVYSQGKHNNQNTLEYKYYKYLEKNNIDFSKIPKCFGYIDTNYGKGLIFERIKNYDDSKIKTFSFYVKHNIFSREYDLKLIEELREYIFKNEILFVDASLSNIFCKIIEENRYELIIFDGLGARRTGFKFWLYLKFERFRKYKIKKQWQKFLQNYEREKSLNIKL